MVTKICTKCKKEKNIEHFSISRRKRKDNSIHEYIISCCKSCENKRKYNNKTNTPEKLIKYKERQNRNRHNSYIMNKEKQLLRAKKWLDILIGENKFKPLWLWQKYKITLEDYNQMREKQNYSCAICHISEQEYGKALHVDHCHETNKIRGLLCLACNTALGSLKDNIGNLTRAIKYLSKA